MSQLTRNECFRLGFLLRCAEEGCDMDEVAERVKLAHDRTKIAAGGVMDWVAGIVRPLWNTAKTVGKFPLQLSALGVAGSALTGMAGGYGLAKMQNEQLDPEEAKQQELISIYRLQADLARRKAQQHSYRTAVPALPRLM